MYHSDGVYTYTVPGVGVGLSAAGVRPYICERSKAMVCSSNFSFQGRFRHSA